MRGWGKCKAPAVSRRASSVRDGAGSQREGSLLSRLEELSAGGRICNATEEVLAETLSQPDSSHNCSTHFGGGAVPSVPHPRGAPTQLGRHAMQEAQVHEAWLSDACDIL